MKTSVQENQTVQNAKPNHPVSPKIAAAPGHLHERETPKDGSSADQPGSSHGQTWPRSTTSANDEAKPEEEKGLEEVEIEQDRVPGAEAKKKTEVGSNS
jgi:hypothetical protein